MSRLLLYRPKQLSFKGYICSIDQYHIKIQARSIDTKCSQIYLSIIKYLRFDLLAKAWEYPPSGYYKFFIIGIWLDYEKLPDYVTGLVKEHSYALGGIFGGTVISGRIDTIYRIKNLFESKHLLINEMGNRKNVLAMRALLYLAVNTYNVTFPFPYGLQIYYLVEYIKLVFPDQLDYADKLAKFILLKNI